MVGAVAVHLLLLDDPPAGQVDPDHVGEAGARDGEQLAVAGGEHVVDVLVVALADALLDREVEGEPVGAGVDVAQLLRPVRDDVERLDPLLAGHVDDRRRAVPVVADEHDVPVAARARARVGGSGRREPGQRHGGGGRGGDPGQAGEAGTGGQVGRAAHGTPCRQRAEQVSVTGYSLVTTAVVASGYAWHVP